MYNNELINVESTCKLIEQKLSHNFGVIPQEASDEQYYKAISLIVQEILKETYSDFVTKSKAQNKKTIYYLSMEFLMGRSLKNNLYNLNLTQVINGALSCFGVDIENIFDQEPDAGLGNGGLGRLAACYLDGLANNQYNGMGYSLRYEFGIFSQKIIDGWQVEKPDLWLPGGEVWLQPRKESAIDVSFNGYVDEQWVNGYHIVALKDATTVKAVPYDMYVPAKDGNGCARLRLWACQSNAFDMPTFNEGEFLRAVEEKAMAESITKVLYPEDNHVEGKSLRLNQQYFLVSATIQDIIKRHLRKYNTLNNLHEFVSIHLNDTHPVLAIPELMRIMLDECGYSWEQAWDIVTKTIAYTNHTVMKEALECWNEQMFSSKLPRIYTIVCEINKRFCDELNYKGIDQQQIDEMTIIKHGVVRMANLAVVASFSVNGVSALHSQLLKDTVFNSFYRVLPHKFTNVTNGIAHRRWLNQSNPKLAQCITSLIGDDYIKDASNLEKLLEFKNDSQVLENLQKIKYENKLEMAKYIKENNGIIVNPNSIFDVQIKRLHEYKRQTLNALHILATYQWILENPNAPFTPKTYIFGAKAAPGYFLAKQIIQFIVQLGNKINNDPRMNDKLKVVFLEDYKVTLAEKLIPASEVSEQISLAGTEASGTGNMKFMLNGALTIGTFDGANVEINQAVGNDNMFLFGMDEHEVSNMYRNGYNASIYYQNNNIIKNVLNELSNMGFAHLTEHFLYRDNYMVLADFADYANAQNRLIKTYNDVKKWNEMSLVNIAKAGIFASDRAVNEYAKNIWNLTATDM